MKQTLDVISRNFWDHDCTVNTDKLVSSFEEIGTIINLRRAY